MQDVWIMNDWLDLTDYIDTVVQEKAEQEAKTRYGH